jgi:hypothetical protein
MQLYTKQGTDYVELVTAVEAAELLGINVKRFQNLLVRKNLHLTSYEVSKIKLYIKEEVLNAQVMYKHIGPISRSQLRKVTKPLYKKGSKTR